MGNTGIDLLQAFQSVSQALGKNRSTLNEMDEYNHDHGDNMVEIFRTITQAMDERSMDSPADQLAYASELLRNKGQSGSAKVYAENLSQAAEQFQGQAVDSGNAMQLVQALLGASPPQPTTPDSHDQSSGGLESLLGGLLGGTDSNQAGQGDGLDLGDVLSAGMAFMQSKQSGKDTSGALLDALMSGSQLSASNHRTQSGKIVADTLIQSILPMLGKRS